MGVRIVGHHPEGTVAGTEVGLVGPGEEDPVPAKLIEVDQERPHAAGRLGRVRLLRTDAVGRPRDTVADVQLDVRGSLGYEGIVQANFVVVVRFDSDDDTQVLLGIPHPILC